MADFKAKLWLYDLSIQEGEEAFEVAIFRREEGQIPKFGPGDVVYLQSARVTLSSPSALGRDVLTCIYRSRDSGRIRFPV